MRKTITTGTVKDYANNFIYENGDLKFFSTPEGYAEPNSKSFDYIYQFRAEREENVRWTFLANLPCRQAGEPAGAKEVSNSIGISIDSEDRYFFVNQDLDYEDIFINHKCFCE